MTEGDYRRNSRLVRLGLALGAAAGLMVALAASVGDLLEGPGREGGIERVAVDGRVTVAGIAVAVVVAACAASPWLSAHLVGLVVAWGGAAAPALFHLIRSRQSERFAPRADLELLPGGTMLLGALLVGLAGIVVCLLGFRAVALAPRSAPAAGEGAAAEAEAEAEAPGPGPGPRRRNAPRAVPALVFGILGFIAWIAAPLGAAYGLLALGDVHHSEGRLGGRGLAVAGIVLGVIALTLAVLLAFLGGLRALPPS